MEGSIRLRLHDIKATITKNDIKKKPTTSQKTGSNQRLDCGLSLKNHAAGLINSPSSPSSFLNDSTSKVAFSICV
jgi:hypothetical protein